MSYLSNGSHPHNIEHDIRTAAVPIPSNESEEANALGYRGILLNRGQINSWTGPIPINQYRLNEDPNPEVITKVSGQPVEYNQEIQVRYLRPPTPAPHGDIIIKEQAVNIILLGKWFFEPLVIFFRNYFSQLFCRKLRHLSSDKYDYQMKILMANQIEIKES